MKNHILPAIRLTFVSMVFFCGIYTVLVWVVAQAAPGSGKGLVIADSKGNRHHLNVGQAFTQDGYFWGRPSAVDYDAAGSGGSNKGPSNPEYLAEVEARIADFLAKNPGVARAEIPSELVTASGSGLDPHISVQAAHIQVARIAKARATDEARIAQLIEQYTEKPLAGLLGTERVNVLQLNIALDSSLK